MMEVKVWHFDDNKHFEFFLSMVNDYFTKLSFYYEKTLSTIYKSVLIESVFS